MSIVDIGLQGFQMPNRLRSILESTKIRPMTLSSPCTQPRYVHALEIY